MMNAFVDLLPRYWYSWLVGLLLAGIAVGFALRFVTPALRLGRELGGAIDGMTKLRDLLATGGDADPVPLAANALAHPRLAVLWQEYAQTLHRQSRPGGAHWRATTLAETFFTEQALVDSPLKTEFYKHLPGILTGLGIIGTFTGLIIGLIQFDVSLDPTQAQTQLRNLINSVGHAFFVSAVAISLAMLFTWIEKSVLTVRYRQVERLRELIDGLFDVGVDVEYLERLVVAAESSAVQAREIKETLAGELRAVLTELAERQADTSARQGERLAADLGRVIGERLGRPIGDIAAAVNSVGERQDQVVSRLVGEVLAGFSANMRDMFAAQMKDSGDLLRQTNDAVAATGERQAEMNRQMSAFATQVQATAAESQARSADMLERALARLGEQVTAAVGSLHEQTQTSARAQEEQLGRLADRSLEVNHSVRGALETLSTASTDAISELNAGAARLAAAATDFARAGHGVAETMDAAAMATASIHSATDVLQKAAATTQDMLAAHARNQETFTALAAELRSTVDTARREASLNATLIDGLQAAAAQLSAAQRKSEEFLRSVNDVLVEAHLSFADNVERSLREGNRQFHVELAQAVGLLSGAIQDLGDLVDNLPATLNRPRSAS
jgi:hypothetical protein